MGLKLEECVGELTKRDLLFIGNVMLLVGYGKNEGEKTWRGMIESDRRAGEEIFLPYLNKDVPLSCNVCIVSLNVTRCIFGPSAL